MSYESRVKLYEKFSTLRGRPLIVYVTSTRPGAAGSMTGQVVPELLNHLSLIPAAEKKVDFLIISHGGDPMVSYRVMWLLRERFPESVSVVLPYEAYSAATLLACGADEILMHPYSNLGPVDIQLITTKHDSDGEKENFEFAVEDLKHFFNFLKQDLKITDQNLIGKGVEYVCNELGPIRVGVAKRASELSVSVAEKMLKNHLEKKVAKKIAKALSGSFYDHGYPLGRKEAADLGLPVVKPSDELNTVMWNIWKDFEEEMVCNKPFDPLQILLSSTEAKDIWSVTKIDIPTNLEESVRKAKIEEALNKIVVIKKVPEITYEFPTHALESIYGTSQVKRRGAIGAIIQPDNRVNVAKRESSSGWEFEARIVTSKGRKP